MANPGWRPDAAAQHAGSRAAPLRQQVSLLDSTSLAFSEAGALKILRADRLDYVDFDPAPEPQNRLTYQIVNYRIVESRRHLVRRLIRDRVNRRLLVSPHQSCRCSTICFGDLTAAAFIDSTSSASTRPRVISLENWRRSDRFRGQTASCRQRA
jgi:hypothetical protein